MPIEPKIPKRPSLLKTCNKCGLVGSAENFARTHSFFYPDGFLPICNTCINEFLKSHDYEWQWIDKVCQWADIPWIVKEWDRLVEMNGVEGTWTVYAQVFAADEYQNLGWADYDAQYRKLRAAGDIDLEVPLLHEEHIKELQRKWGANYSEEDLMYLEDLHKGILVSQNVNGDLQDDQAKKLCKISLEVDSKIRAGDKDVDKFLSSYEKLVKIADFTPKNTRNAADFDSFAEVCMWLEKRGRQNKFYDNTTRDVIDETLKNIEAYNQRLYINEGGIGDEITQRLNALKSANDLEESVFDLQKEFDLDEYENLAFNGESNEFEVDEEEIE